MPYSVSARGYLHRAKLRLLENSNEAIFYGAFELRCCVEARQEEYATAIDFIKKRLNLGKLERPQNVLRKYLKVTNFVAFR